MADVIADLLVKIGADISGMQQGFATAEARLTTFGQQTTAAGTSLVKLGAPLTALGGLAATTAGDFEASMNILAVAAGGSGASLEDLRDVAITAGADVNLVGVGAADVAEAMTNMTKAGVSTSDMLGDMEGYLSGNVQMGGALRAAIDLAAASELDLDQASKLVVTTMATFGLSAEDASAAMDTYVRAADASVLSVGDIEAAMQNVGPTMAQFGFSVEDTSAALAILSTRGIVGAEAGTALKSMFTNLMRPTEAVTSTLDALNVTLYDSSGNMKPLEQIVKELSGALGEGAISAQTFGGATEEQQKQLAAYETKMKSLTTEIEMYTTGAKGANLTEAERAAKLTDLTAQLGYYTTEHDTLAAAIPPVTKSMALMTEEERNQHIQTLAGTYGMKAMATLLADGAPGWDKMATSIGGAATMQETAAARTQGFNAKMEQLKSTIETFLINVGTPLIQNVLTPMIQRFTEIIGGIAELDPKWVGLGIVVAGVVTVLGTVLVIAGQIATGMAALAPIVGAVGAPFLIIAAAVAAFALAWTNNWFGIRDTLTAVWEGTIKPAFEAIKLVIDGLVGVLTGTETSFGDWTSWWEALAKIVGEDVADAIADIVYAFGDVVDWLKTNIPLAIQTLAGFWNDTLLPALQAVWKFISETLIPIFVTIVTWLATTIVEAIKTLAGFWNDTLLPALQAVWKFISETLIPIFVTIVTWLATTIGDAIKTLAGYWNETLLPAIRAVYNFINDTLIPIFRTIVTWLATDIGNAIKTLKGFWEDTLLPAMRGVYNFINDYLVPIFRGIKDVMEAVGNLIDRTLRGALENVLAPALRTAGNAAETNLKNGLKSASDFLGDTFGPALATATNFLNNTVIPAMNTAGTNIGTGLGQAIKDLTALWNDKLLPALQDIWGFIQYSVLKVFSDLTSALGTTLQGPLSAVKELWEKLQESLGKIPQILTDIATWFGTLAGKIRALELPDWLTPGSPTPLETALLGIFEALKKVAGGPWQWFTDFVKFVTGGGGGSGGPVTNINVTMSPGAVVVYNTDPTGANDIGLAMARALKALIDAETTAGAAASGTYPPPWKF